MDSQKKQINTISTKLNTKKGVDKTENPKIVINLPKPQLTTRQQPAQDRLNRLQTHLKQLNKTRQKERIQHKRIGKSNNHNTASTAKSQSQITAYCAAALESSCTPSRNNVVTLRQHHLSEKSKSAPAKTTCSTYVATAPSGSSKCCGNSSVRLNLKNTALFDASNRLESNQTKSANHRLAQLRKSLQETQQTQPQHKETNNNNIYTVISDINSITTTATQISKTVQENPAEDDIEPMEVEWEEHFEGTSDNKTANHDEFNWDDDVEMTLVRHIPDGQQTPAVRVDHMYFVLDTNVLLDGLVFVENLTRLALENTSGSILYLPYIVIKELDKLNARQADNGLQRKMAVRAAIRYLNNKFDNGLQIQAQSAIEESEHLIDIDCPDDSIVNCCLQLKEQVPQMMLLTNDNNLRLKANASAIKVSRSYDLMRDYQDQFDALPS